MSEDSIEITTPEESVPVESPRERLSIPETLIGVIIHPYRTFERMRTAERGHWWIVAVLAALLAVVGVIATSRITMAASEEELRRALDMDGDGELTGTELETFEQAQTFATNPVFTVALPAIGGLIGLALGYAVRGGVLFLLGMALGGRTRFGPVFRMAVWTTLPDVVRSLLSATVTLVTGRIPASGLSAVMTSAEASAAPVVSAFLSGIDFYTVWGLALIALGMAATAQMSKGKGAVVALIWWALVTLVSVGMVALSLLLASQMGFAAG
ncbi:MAG: hypothetical protein Kow00124_27860 [Anaerolineae bacterium]